MPFSVYSPKFIAFLILQHRLRHGCRRGHCAMPSSFFPISNKLEPTFFLLHCMGSCHFIVQCVGPRRKAVILSTFQGSCRRHADIGTKSSPLATYRELKRHSTYAPKHSRVHLTENFQKEYMVSDVTSFAYLQVSFLKKNLTIRLTMVYSFFILHIATSEY
jgi:hypothetical protein